MQIMLPALTNLKGVICQFPVNDWVYLSRIRFYLKSKQKQQHPKLNKRRGHEVIKNTYLRYGSMTHSSWQWKYPHKKFLYNNLATLGKSFLLYISWLLKWLIRVSFSKFDKLLLRHNGQYREIDRFWWMSLYLDLSDIIVMIRLCWKKTTDVLISGHHI